jgi:hypothetical protein
MAKIYESPDRGKTVYQREAGSLDKELVHKSNASDRELFAIPESLIKESPNDNDLGAAVRKLYWQSKGK